MIYAVVYPDSPHYGQVVSRHRTAASAQAAIDREMRALRRTPGQERSWVERRIVPTNSLDNRLPLYGQCAVCDGPIGLERSVAARSRGGYAIYCSERCKTTATRRRQRARQRASKCLHATPFPSLMFGGLP